MTKKRTKTKALVKPPETKPEKPEFIYVITDKAFGELKVRNSDNAWWIDRPKVDRLITAFKNGHDVPEARVYAGISRHQLAYFITTHPEFSAIMEDCAEVANIVARNSVVTQMAQDGNLAFKWMERKKAGEFGLKPPVMAFQFNIATKVEEDRKEFEVVVKEEQHENSAPHV